MAAPLPKDEVHANVALLHCIADRGDLVSQTYELVLHSCIVALRADRGILASQTYEPVLQRYIAYLQTLIPWLCCHLSCRAPRARPGVTGDE